MDSGPDDLVTPGRSTHIFHLRHTQVHKRVAETRRRKEYGQHNKRTVQGVPSQFKVCAILPLRLLHPPLRHDPRYHDSARLEPESGGHALPLHRVHDLLPVAILPTK